MQRFRRIITGALPLDHPRAAPARAYLTARGLADTLALKLVMERLIPTLKPETTPLTLDLGKDQEKLERVALNAIIQAMAAGDLAPDCLPKLIEAVEALGRMRNTADSHEKTLKLFGSLI